MIRHGVLVALVLQSTNLNLVSPAKQQLQLSDSYLPVSMQIIAHITDQLTYADKQDLNKPTTQPTTSKPWTTTSKRPSRKPTTPKPLDWTTPLHKPGLYAPEHPPNPDDRKDIIGQKGLSPIDEEPDDETKEDTSLSLSDEEENSSDEYQSKEDQVEKALDRSTGGDDEYDAENLQYLDPDVRNLIILANNPNDDRLVDVWDGRSGPPLMANKAHGGSLSSTHLRLLLLYDLLSREAKKQKLTEFHGFSDSVMQELIESSKGSAGEQLKFALSKMLTRHDCDHDYANNRAREIVTELGKDGSTISSELRYLKTLNYAL